MQDYGVGRAAGAVEKVVMWPYVLANIHKEHDLWRRIIWCSGRHTSACHFLCTGARKEISSYAARAPRGG